MSKLIPMTLEEAETALSGFVTFSGQSRKQPDAFALRKRGQGLRVRVSQLGGRAMLGQGDPLGTTRVSFWVAGI